MSIDFGIALLSVGTITLGEQVARRNFTLKPEGFWEIVGLFFLVGGFWEIANVELPLAPILLIVAGLALLYSMFRGVHLIRKSTK